MLPERDLEALLRVRMRPARPRLDEARAVASEAGEPRAAWEACAARGLIPAAWVDEPARSPAKACWGCSGAQQVEGTDASSGWSTGWWQCTPCAGAGVLSEPWTLDLVVALASDAEGVLGAEELAREVALRLVGAPGARADRRGPPERFHWVTVRVRPGHHVLHALGSRVSLGEFGDVPAHSALLEQARKLDRETTYVAEAIAQDLALELAWAKRAEDGEARFAGRANPFTPLVDLWAAGYALDCATDTAVCLVTPAP